MKALKYGIPLAIFIGLCVFLALGLTKDPRKVPSPFIGKPAPQFTLGELHNPEKAFSPEQMKGQVWLLNVWASWCAACRVEHPLLNDVSRRGVVPIVGLNYKDQRPDAQRWLQQFGDPYRLSVWDIDGKVADLITRWADCVFFIDKKVRVLEEQGGFGKKERKAIEAVKGARFLFTESSPTHPGGCRDIFGMLPMEIPLPRTNPWQAFMGAVAKSMETTTQEQGE